MTSKNNNVAVLTLGCSKNIVDSEVLLKQIQNSNIEIVDDINHASTLIINTCGFIQDAKKESIETIIKAVDLKNQGKLRKVIVMGCLSERYAAELKKEIPEVDTFIGTNDIVSVTKELGIKYNYKIINERYLLTPAHYAYLKISEGCDNPCSFCAIPLIKGKYISKPIEKIVLETENLVASGVKELILIGQDTTYYGIDIYGKRTLGLLLRKLSSIKGIEWIRLMYTYPAKFPEDILDTWIDNSKLCKYIDIPVQHISDKVLRSMRRGISARSIYSLIDKIRNKIPGIALRTSLIVGYPNETEDEFRKLVNFVKEVKFERLGVFMYSAEENTLSYKLGDPIPYADKNNRFKTLMDIQKQISYKKNRKFIGKYLKVLVDNIEGSKAICRSEFDAPEIDNSVIIESPHILNKGNFYDVKIVNSNEYDLIAKYKPEYHNK